MQGARSGPDLELNALLDEYVEIRETISQQSQDAIIAKLIAAKPKVIIPKRTRYVA